MNKITAEFQVSISKTVGDRAKILVTCLDYTVYVFAPIQV